MSDTATRPPGLRTRNISRNTDGLSGTTRRTRLAAVDYQDGSRRSSSLGLRVWRTVLELTIIVVFPVPLDAFQQRKSVSAVIWPYNYTVPIVLTK